jgi:hypothetical protein
MHTHRHTHTHTFTHTECDVYVKGSLAAYNTRFEALREHMRKIR